MSDLISREKLSEWCFETMLAQTTAVGIAYVHDFWNAVLNAPAVDTLSFQLAKARHYAMLLKEGLADNDMTDSEKIEFVIGFSDLIIEDATEEIPNELAVKYDEYRSLGTVEELKKLKENAGCGCGICLAHNDMKCPNMKEDKI